MARILVIGASQGIGLAVCETAAARGHIVRGLSRRGTLPGSAAHAITAIKGDALNPRDVAGALVDTDVVVQALGVPASLDLLSKPVSLFSSATRVLLSEMAKAGVRKIVCVTGFGAGDSRASISFLQRLPFELVLGRAYDDKSVQEGLIESSDTDWLIVRPGVLVNCHRVGNYRVLTSPGAWRNGIVARVDVADFIVKRIEADRLGREKPVIVRIPL
ncbi:MAG: NAD-dependent epimerase/dehydratase family protein [Hyphomicrobiales bacterium]|nr:MAG: NAD-dependent epimerase/dehydratase family protein [Hyphomicrobiales bacterium]